MRYTNPRLLYFTYFTVNSFRQLFPDEMFSPTFSWLLVKSLTFPWQLSNSLTFPGFPNKWSPCYYSEMNLPETLHLFSRLQVVHLWMMRTSSRSRRMRTTTTTGTRVAADRVNENSDDSSIQVNMCDGVSVSIGTVVSRLKLWDGLSIVGSSLPTRHLW